MSNRMRLYDARLSDLPRSIGLCSADVSGVARAVNTAQRRLLYCKEAGSESWFGTWAEVAFNFDPTKPYLTLPREIARLEAVTICNKPVPVRNQFYEYLTFGNGRLPKNCGGRGGCLDIYSRNNSPTWVDLSSPPQMIRVYSSSPDDSGKRILIQGDDSNGSPIYSADGTNNTLGQFIAFEQPFAAFPYQMNRITGIQKDITVGTIQIKQVDPTSGAEVTLLTMDPGEQTAWYRRYYFNGLPNNCCPGQTTVQVTAIAKLEFIPVQVDTDYCLLQNIEALIEEAQSNRYSGIDEVSAKQMASSHHRDAVGLLNGELSHYFGKNDASVGFFPFGSARLEYIKIGMI